MLFYNTKNIFWLYCLTYMMKSSFKRIKLLAQNALHNKIIHAVALHKTYNEQFNRTGAALLLQKYKTSSVMV